MSFSSDGASLATADEAGVLISWDLGSARPLATTLSHAGPIWSLAYSKGSSKVLASGGADCAVRLWSECEAQAVVPGAQQPPTEDGVAAPAHTPLATWFTKATPVVAASFTRRNLLLTAGPLSVQDVVRRP